MVDYLELLKNGFAAAIKKLHSVEIDKEKINISPTRKEHSGDYTIVLFPYLKQIKTNPVRLGEAVGDFLVKENEYIAGYSVVKGFLNLSFSQTYWYTGLKVISDEDNYGNHPRNGRKVMIEFSSPNTNKPLHLGHVRNILLGWSTARIMEAAGYDTIKVQIVNDRGIAICKSMLAWQEFGEGSTPASTGIKSDHFVGKYYVRFEKEFQAEYKGWQSSTTGQEIFAKNGKETENESEFFKRYKNEYFNEYSNLGQAARNMLLAWESGESEVKELWEKMNNWVYAGFNSTYEQLGVHFDKLYYESETYLLGKKTIDYGMQKGFFYREEDGSVWVDLEDAGYDKKILLRSDGTSVYMTQDIGTAMARYRDFKPEKMVYVVADEQDYHFKVLFEILKRLEEPYANGLHHLSYGMVDLPEGRMKSREGTVVDADDLIRDVILEARKSAEERGDIPGETEEEKTELLGKIGLAALKFFMIKVTPQKRMTFNPKDSVDMQGQTGPYIQNAYVRIKSILRRLDEIVPTISMNYELHADEKTLLKILLEFPALITQAAENYDPSSIANYAYNLAKAFHKFYHDFRIIGAETKEAKNFRIELIANIAKVLKKSMELLGIEMPERM